MLSKRWLTVVASVAAIAPGAAFGASKQRRSNQGESAFSEAFGGDPARAAAPQQTNPIFVDYFQSYANLGDMAKASDAVVLARTGPSHNSVEGNTPFTDFTMTVLASEKGSLGTGDSFVLHQTGGYNATGQLAEVTDDPLLEIGTDYLLFLQHDPSSGVYFVVDGPEGRLVVHDSEVISLSSVYKQRHIGDLGLSNKSLTDVAANIR